MAAATERRRRREVKLFCCALAVHVLLLHRAEAIKIGRASEGNSVAVDEE